MSLDVIQHNKYPKQWNVWLWAELAYIKLASAYLLLYRNSFMEMEAFQHTYPAGLSGYFVLGSLPVTSSAAFEET